MTSSPSDQRLLTRRRGVAVAFTFSLCGWSEASLAQQSSREFLVAVAEARTFGAFSGDGSSEFGKIVGALVRPNGSVIVGDAYSKTVQAYDPFGRHVRTVGREGAGPGEFRVLSWLGPCGIDHFATYDEVLNRIIIFDDGGRMALNRVLPSGLLFIRPVACTTERSLVFLRDQPAAKPQRSMTVRPPAILSSLNLTTGEVDSLGAVPGNEYYFANEVGGFGELPGGGLLHSVAGPGFVVLAASDQPTIHLWTVSDRTSSVIRVPLTPRSLSSREFAQAIQSRLAEEPKRETRELLKRVYAQAPRPTSAMVVADVAADSEGLIWIKTAGPHRSGRARWIVLDGRGIKRATATLPSSSKPVWIGATSLLLVNRDSAGTQMLTLHRLVR